MATDKKTPEISEEIKKKENFKDNNSNELDERVEQLAQSVDADQLQERILTLSQNKSAQTAVFVVLGLIVLAIAGVFGWQWHVKNQELKAQVELYPVQYYYEQDSLQAVVAGDAAQTVGATKISEEYGMTKAGELAAFYAGVAYLKEGKYNEAISALRNFKANDYLVQARAYSLIGDAYMELSKLPEAVNYYTQAAKHHPNDVFTPTYLMKLGLAHELQNEFDKAAQAYKTIVDNHKKSDLFIKAKRAMYKAEALQQKAS